MPLPSLLGDRVVPAWQALTAEQRVCWHFWAAAHPMIVEDGDLQTLYGYQAYYSKNAPLFLPDTEQPISEPPATTTPPPRVLIISVAWPIGSQIVVGTNPRRGFAFLQLTDTMPADTIGIVVQGYRRQKKNPRKSTGTRHVTILLPLAEGNIDLQAASGYFASTAGDTKYARIKGITARRRPDLPLGKLTVVNTTNGETVEQILSNPNGGAKKKIKRPKHYP